MNWKDSCRIQKSIIHSPSFLFNNLSYCDDLLLYARESTFYIFKKAFNLDDELRVAEGM